jgi:hypothetical protein
LQAAGVSIARIEVGQDGVTIVPGEPTKKTATDIEAAVARIDAKLRRSAAKKQGG